MGTEGTPARTVSDWVWAPFSVVAWSLSLSIMAIAVLVAGIGCLFIPFERFQRMWSSPVFGLCLPASGGLRRIRIHPSNDPSRTSVYIQNHVSVLDAHAATSSIPSPFCGLNNAAHLKLPIYGWMLTLAHTIPVSPGAGAGRYQAIARAFVERRRLGVSILAFPEGHRTLDGKVRPFRRGVFAAAAEAGMPVVPLMTRGLHRLLPKGTWLVKPSVVEILVGPQIETEGLTTAQVSDLAATMQRMHAAWSERGEDVIDAELAAFRERVAGAAPTAPDPPDASEP